MYIEQGLLLCYYKTGLFKGKGLLLCYCKHVYWKVIIVLLQSGLLEMVYKYIIPICMLDRVDYIVSLQTGLLKSVYYCVIANMFIGKLLLCYRNQDYLKGSLLCYSTQVYLKRFIIVSFHTGLWELDYYCVIPNMFIGLSP